MEGEIDEVYANQLSHPNLGDDDVDLADEELVCEGCELHPEECECASIPDEEDGFDDDEVAHVPHTKTKKPGLFASSAKYAANPLVEATRTPAKRPRSAGKEPRSSLSRNNAAPDLFGYFSQFDISPMDAVAVSRTFANYICNQERVKNKEKPKRGGYRQYN